MIGGRFFFSHFIVSEIREHILLIHSFHLIFRKTNANQ